jgi:hypothetical protein
MKNKFEWLTVCVAVSLFGFQFASAQESRQRT